MKSLGLLCCYFYRFLVVGEFPSIEVLQTCRVFICDETTPQLYRYFFDNLQPTQHCLLFSSDNRPQLEHYFRIFHLSSCLRSTNQIAQFANRFVDRSPKNVFFALPTASLAGEPVEVAFLEENDEETISPEQQFLEKCVAAIRRHSEKFRDQTYIVVFPFLKQKFLSSLKSELEKLRYICQSDMAPYAINVDEHSESVGNHARRVFFCHPRNVEGCEFMSSLILIDAGIFDTFTASSYGNNLLTAITRATLKVEIIVKNSEILSLQDMTAFMNNVQREKMKPLLEFVENNPSEPMVLFVGKLPEDSQFQRKVDHLTNSGRVETLSLYKNQNGNGSFYHVDDMFLEDQFRTFNEMGIRQIFIGNKDISCTWQYLYYIASIHCGRRYCLQNSDNLVFHGHAFNPRVMKFQVNLHLDFLRQESSKNDSTTYSNNFWADFDEYMPTSYVDKWTIWKAKALELYRIGEITTSIIIMECSIKLLKKQIDNGTKEERSSHLLQNEVLELSILLTTLAKIYVDHSKDIVRGTRLHYNFDNTHFEEGLIKAFKYGFEALKLNVDKPKTFQTMRLIIWNLRNYSDSEGFKLSLRQLGREESCGMKTERFWPEFRSETMSDSLRKKMQSLEKQIRDFESSQSVIRSSTKLRNDLYTEAKKLSEESLGSFEDACCGYEQLLRRFEQVFQFPVQLAMVAIQFKNLNETRGQTVDICILKSTEELEKLLDQLEKEVTAI